LRLASRCTAMLTLG
jgi:serine/threonine protein kinase